MGGFPDSTKRAMPGAVAVSVGLSSRSERKVARNPGSAFGPAGEKSAMKRQTERTTVHQPCHLTAQWGLKLNFVLPIVEIGSVSALSSIRCQSRLNDNPEKKQPSGGNGKVLELIRNDSEETGSARAWQRLVCGIPSHNARKALRQSNRLAPCPWSIGARAGWNTRGRVCSRKERNRSEAFEPLKRALRSRLKEAFGRRRRAASQRRTVNNGFGSLSWVRMLASCSEVKSLAGT